MSVCVSANTSESEKLESAEMAAEKDAILSIPKFDGDYEHWAMLMENLIRSKEWWHLVETGYTEPAIGDILNGAQRRELAELKLTDLKVNNYLFQAIDKTTLKTITQKDTAKQLLGVNEDKVPRR